MKIKTLTSSLSGAAIITAAFLMPAYAYAEISESPADSSKTISDPGQQKRRFLDRLSFGGYGEATFTHNFFSDDYKRYTDPKSYTHGSHSRFDLPHVCFSIGFDFGKGWSFGSEIEYEHGGVEAATEIETEEAGEYETEVERGGEVALEQLWIQKIFLPPA